MSRRAVVRAGAVGTAGFMAAALLGCTAEEDAPPTGAAPRAPTPTDQAAVPTDDVKRGGVGRFGRDATDVALYDQHQTASLHEVQALVLVYDQLLQYDPFNEGEIIPNLAHSWEFPDETTIVFHLNEATFHDGTPFTSEDVVASIERMKDPPEGVTSLRKANFAIVDGVDAPDARTAVFRMTRPSAAFVPLMATSFMSMYSAKNIQDDSFDFREQINGTGPYKLERYDRGSRLAYSRNANWYEEGLPYLDGVEIYLIPEEVTRLAAFQGNDLDAFPPSAVQAQVVEDMPDATLLISVSFSYWAYTIATWKEPWTDPRTWEAVSLTTDREATNLAISEGRGFTGGPLPPGGYWALPESYMVTVPGYTGDLTERRTEARRLLDAAGVPEGTHIEVFGRGDSPSFENHAVIFADGLQHLGFTTNLTLPERATYDERLQAKDFGDMAANSRNASMDDPTPVFAENYINGAGRHYTGLVIAEVDELFERQESALDPEERRELADAMQKAYLDVYPMEIAHFGEARYAHHDYLNGYGVLYGNARASRKLQYVWLDR